jgi:hypothetical protein
MVKSIDINIQDRDRINSDRAWHNRQIEQVKTVALAGFEWWAMRTLLKIVDI